MNLKYNQSDMRPLISKLYPLSIDTDQEPTLPASAPELLKNIRNFQNKDTYIFVRFVADSHCEHVAYNIKTFDPIWKGNNCAILKANNYYVELNIDWLRRKPNLSCYTEIQVIKLRKP